MLPRASLKSHALDCLVPDKKRYSDDWAKAGVPDHLSMRDAQSTPNKNGGSRDNFTACLGCKSSVEVNMGWHQKTQFLVADTPATMLLGFKWVLRPGAKPWYASEDHLGVHSILDKSITF